MNEQEAKQVHAAFIVVGFAALGLGIMAWAILKYALASRQVLIGLKAFGVPFVGLAGVAVAILALICADGWRIRNQ